MQQCVPTKKVARNERHLGYGNEAKTCLEAETPLACAAGIEKSTTKREKGYIVDRRERRLCVCPHFVVWARRVCEKQKATSFIERIHRTSWGVRARKPFARIFGQSKKRKNRRVALFKYRSHTLAGCVLAGNEISTARLGRFF